MERSVAAEGLAQSVVGWWTNIETALERDGQTDALRGLRAARDVYLVAAQPITHSAGNALPNAGPPQGPAQPATNRRRDTP